MIGPTDIYPFWIGAAIRFTDILALEKGPLCFSNKVPLVGTGGDWNCLMPVVAIFFLLTEFLKAIAPPPALLIFPYFFVVLTSNVR